MIEAFLAWLVATFLLGPIQAGMTSRLEAARAPTAVVRQVTDCAAEAAPRLVARATEDPVWAVTTAIGAWIGTTDPVAVLRDAGPACPAAMQAARPFLAEG